MLAFTEHGRMILPWHRFKGIVREDHSHQELGKVHSHFLNTSQVQTSVDRSTCPDRSGHVTLMCSACWSGLLPFPAFTGSCWAAGPRDGGERLASEKSSDDIKTLLCFYDLGNIQMLECFDFIRGGQSVSPLTPFLWPLYCFKYLNYISACICQAEIFHILSFPKTTWRCLQPQCNLLVACFDRVVCYQDSADWNCNLKLWLQVSDLYNNPMKVVFSGPRSPRPASCHMSHHPVTLWMWASEPGNLSATCQPQLKREKRILWLKGIFVI